ncbi:MAG: sulfite exporter TauE/SafE family protein [Archaeoglobus sp.]|uniref:sulfite exporter TauE/SafE family protein n=1 Tax=Archaeoglobus sp. TaxID=1872626 RepID=UPI001DB49579|nr:sulfite exporter TauE/SafE family protein [Archaeoglobus sp.]MBO8180892.1 sulfite exporter TauE/SafE family protein [Archaeoglobus sp.]
MQIPVAIPTTIQFFVEVFAFCFSIGFVAIIAGTGGGVLFTSFLLGFTSIHPDIVRATGLLSAVAGTRMGAQTYLRSIANIRIALFLAAPYTVFAVIGAYFGLYLTGHFGTYGVAILKLMLGLIVLFIGVHCTYSLREQNIPKARGIKLLRNSVSKYPIMKNLLIPLLDTN